MNADQKLIEQLNPKPVFNTKWYKGKDLYSEGDIEDLTSSLIASYPPEDYVDAIYENFSWNTYYHLSHIRQNILNWYPFDAEADLLEIGCGMGAITGMLCDRVGSVTSVELSMRRATATRLRCREKENLEIIVGNLNDIEFEKKYDYITLIGVLEYQGNYTDTDNPYYDFLKKIRSLLKPTGKLFIAIENRYGLKYWCGAREDHTGKPFDGINGYIGAEGVRTFSLRELDDLIKKTGFKYTFFYYPMPDYKLPTVIYSEDETPSNGNMLNMQPYYIPDDSTVLINERSVWHDVIANDVFGFFSNSFLVECSDEPGDKDRVTFATMSTARLPEYRIGTRFIRQDRVEKFSVNAVSPCRHIDTIFNNEKKLNDNGVRVLKGNRIQNGLSYEYVKKELLEHRILDLIYSDKCDEALMLMDDVYADIMKSSPHIPSTENLIFSFGLDSPENAGNYGPVLETAYLDMVFRNAFIEEDEFLWFDQEWTLEKTPASFVMFRAVRELWVSYPDIDTLLPLERILERFGITDHIGVYTDVEKLFEGAVADARHYAESKAFEAKK